MMYSNIATANLDVATRITTPITLAALFFILAAGALKLVTPKNQPSVERRSLLKYGFILAMTLSIFANVIYVITASFNREVRISGTIHAEDGKGLGRAIVEIPGKGRGITDDYGSFQFPIPDVYADDSYDTNISLEGYKPEHLILKGRNPKPINATLKSLSIADEVSVTVDDDIFVKHGLGIPAVDIHMAASNGMPAAVTISDFSLELRSFKGKKISLPLMMLSFSPGGQYLPPIQQLVIQPRQPQQYYFLFSYMDFAMNVLADKANKEFLPPVGSYTMPDESRKVYSDELTRQLKAYMDSHFVWEAGEWKFTFYYVVNGKKMGYVRHFDLDDATIANMKNIRDHYQYGIGVLNQWAFLSGVDYNPVVRVTLSK